MELRAADSRGFPGLGQAAGGDRLPVFVHGAAAARGEVDHVQLVTGLTQQEQGSSHHEFDIIGMGGNRQDHGLRHA